MRKKLILITLCVFTLLATSFTAAIQNSDINKNSSIELNDNKVGIVVDNLVKVDNKFLKVDSNKNVFKDETQITISEFDESHPAVDLDYNSNPFLIYQSYEEFGTSKIYFQRSSDGGLTWPDESIWVLELEDLTPIKPDVDFSDGVHAFGTFEFEAQDPLLYFNDFVDIDDSETWSLYYFDRSGYSSYISETDIAANENGAVAIACIMDYEGDDYYEDTILITWDSNNFVDGEADGGVYWMNQDSEGNSIPRSHLSGDAGEKIFFCFESKEIDKPYAIYSAYCEVDENTEYSDWNSRVVARSTQFNCTYPDISVSGSKAYCVYMSDINGNQDIYVAVTTSGTFWNKYQVTDSMDDEMYPVISANGDKATCLFMKNGDLYKTSTEDSGETWSTPEQINTHSNSVVEEYQNIDINGIYGFWTDDRWDNEDIYFDIVGLEPALTIDEIKGGLGVSVSISNVGNAPAEDVSWSIDITGGFLLTGSNTEGSLSLGVGSSKTVKSSFIFGLGRVSIVTTFDDITKTANGLVIGPFVILT